MWKNEADLKHEAREKGKSGDRDSAGHKRLGTNACYEMAWTVNSMPHVERGPP
jgi:hypothetical protein